MTDQQKKILAGGGFGVLALGVLWYQLSDSAGTPAPPPPPVITVAGSASSAGAGGTGSSKAVGTGGTGTAAAGAKHVGTTAAELDPTLRMGPMLVTESLVYTGLGRNIFSGASVPVALPKPVGPARPKVVPGAAPVYVAQGPPPPPVIDLKFFGTATSTGGGRQAFLLRGEDVILASAGDVVQRRYKVVSIAANSMVVEDLVNSNRQTLPLLAN